MGGEDEARGVLPKNLGGGVGRASGNPFPVLDQIMRYFLQYFRRDAKLHTVHTLFQTRPLLNFVCVNI